MKIKKKKVLLLTLALLAIAQWHVKGQIPVLRFGEDGRFTVLQLTDLHIDVKSPNTDSTLLVARELISREDPDLVVLTGDIVTRSPASQGWTLVVNLLAELRQPYVVTLGNHDPETIAKDSIFDILEGAPYCLSQRGPRELSGRGNQEIRIMAPEDDSIAGLLYLLDSHQYYPDQSISHYDIVHLDQLCWLHSKHLQTMGEVGDRVVPSLLFLHTPFPEYRFLKEDSNVVGVMEWDVNSPRINSGLYSTLMDIRGMMGAFCGHDHSNNAIGVLHGLSLGYGQVSGIDAYGGLERGGRMIVLYWGDLRYDTWIVTPESSEKLFPFSYPLTSRKGQSTD